MNRKRSILLVLALAFCCYALAQPPRATNAALRYWMAFALIDDPPGDAAAQTLLRDTAASEIAWDEKTFGSLIEKNRTAIEIMVRATALPECDWGLEYQLGPETPIAHLARARVLARLNVLSGIRELARNNPNEAVNAWSAGLR